MSSKDDKAHKTAASIYTDAMGNLNAEPDYVQFMKRAFKDKDEDLVNSLLHKGKEFEGPDAKDNVMTLLQSHLEQQKSKTKTPSTWAERVKSEKDSQSKSQNRNPI
jgi:hypothetical protein